MVTLDQTLYVLFAYKISSNLTIVCLSECFQTFNTHQATHSIIVFSGQSEQLTSKF